MGKWTQTHMEAASLYASPNPSPSKSCFHLRWIKGMMGGCIAVYKNDAIISYLFLSVAAGMDGTSMSFPITLDPFCAILVLCLVSLLLLSVAGRTSCKALLLNKSSPALCLSFSRSLSQGWLFPGWTSAWSFLPHAGHKTKTAFHTLITYTLVLIAFGKFLIRGTV